jgi:phosphoribosylanthranilate isomerase
MWVKVCANTSLEDAQLAATAGADAVGFVFAESVRRVSVEQVRAITSHLPEAVAKYGVFVDAGVEEIAATIKECGLTGVQLHASQDAALARNLRELFPAVDGRARLGIVRVIHYGGDLAERLHEAQQDDAIDAVLVDSRTATLLGGTGQRFDWQQARGNLACVAGLRLVVAGGLNPDNVAEAVETLRPWGVDVATGVEASPGKKDPAKVRAFIENARIAATNAKLEVEIEV